MTTTTTTTTTPAPTKITETLLVSSGNVVYNIEYSGTVSVTKAVDMGSFVGKMIYGEDTHRVYISSNNNLYLYTNDYYRNSSEFNRVLSVANADRTVVDLYHDNYVWAVQSYNGKVIKMDASTLLTVKTYSGFDTPFKIRYSDYHRAYFIAGSHILWKIDDLGSVASPIYEINDYSIKDFDVSETGAICMVLGGTTQNIIRILEGNNYTFLLNQSTLENLRFCRYCKAGRFYILAELDTGNSLYSASHYVFNIQNKTLNRVSSEDAVSVTTTTTTPPVVTQAIKIQSPVAGDYIQIGHNYDIKWLSNKSASDSVSIDLYKGDILYKKISEKTTNTGIYGWKVEDDIEEDNDYKIKVTWLSTVSESDMSGYVNIFKIVPVTTTTTTTTQITGYAIGIDYASASDSIVIVMKNGFYMTFDLEKLSASTISDLGIYDIFAMASRSMVIEGFYGQTKARIFVGSSLYSNDRWDSGVVETNLNSMYYGGGNNLEPGRKYYAHIQTYDRKRGWGDVVIQEFVMPKN